MKTGTINAAFVFGLAALLSLQGASAAKLKNKSTSGAPADYFPLRSGDAWTYRNTSEGGYTLKIVSEEPQQGGTVRYTVELAAGVKVLKIFSLARLLKYQAAIPAIAIRKTTIEIGTTRDPFEIPPAGGGWDTGTAADSFGSMTR